MSLILKGDHLILNLGSGLMGRVFRSFRSVVKVSFFVFSDDVIDCSAVNAKYSGCILDIAIIGR